MLLGERLRQRIRGGLGAADFDVVRGHLFDPQQKQRSGR
jgi:hypothetical protein